MTADNPTITRKVQGLYVAYAPLADLYSYGACFEEAVNGLADQLQNWPGNADQRTGAEREPVMSSADRPFQCPVCRRGFRSYSSLKHHMDEHTPPRRCRNCGKQLRDDEYHRC